MHSFIHSCFFQGFSSATTFVWHRPGVSAAVQWHPQLILSQLGGGGQIMPTTLLQAPPKYLDSPTALARELTWSYYEEQLRAALSSVYAVLKKLVIFNLPKV